MNVVEYAGAGTKWKYDWPEGSETFDWIEFQARTQEGVIPVRIGYCKRRVYGRERARVVVFIDGHPHAEFLGADDFDKSGDVLSEIRVPGDQGLRMCRYPDDAVPERYSGFNVCGLPTRVSGPGLRNAWAVVANVSDVRTMINLAGMRRFERQ